MGCPKDKKKQVLVRMWRKENPVHGWWECELVQPLWKTAQRFFEKLKIESPCHLAVPLLGINPKEMESEP